MATMQNPAWFLYGPGSAKIQETSLPTIQDDHDVMIRISYVGVCGSDVHFWKHGGFRLKVDAETPLILGHEASGEIASVGSAVTSVQVGDIVAIEPGFPCRMCKTCKDGFYNLCAKMRFAAAPPDTNGCLTKFWVAPEDFVYKLPPQISLQEAVLVEPTAVAVHAVRLAKVHYGQTVMVIGSGTVGLLCAAVAQAFGATRVILVDILEKKLEFAKSFLPTCETILTDVNASAEQNAIRILKTFNILEQGVDTVIEASGAASSVQTGIHSLKPGGSYVQAGLGRSEIEFPILAMSEKELRVRGCFRYRSGDYDFAVSLIARRQIEPSRLITSTVPFEEAILAWEKTGAGQGIKNVIEGARD